MRPHLLIPILIIVPFVIFYFLKAMTGDGLSAVVLGLTLFVSIAAWFAGPASAAGRSAGG